MILAVTKRTSKLKALTAKKVRAFLLRIVRSLYVVEVQNVTRHNTEAPLARLRYATCEKCPFFTAQAMCKKCGCFMPAKVQLTGAKCPEGKW